MDISIIISLIILENIPERNNNNIKYNNNFSKV